VRFCAGCGAALEAPSAPREERKVVSVVFADLVGSTAVAERSDPEDVRAMLAAHHALAERTGGETAGLREALAFYESAGATAYLARARRLQASASGLDAAAH